MKTTKKLLKNKYTTLLAVGVTMIVLITLGFAVLNRSPQINSIIDNKKAKPEPADEFLSNREIAIREAMENPGPLRKTKINGEIYILTGYSETTYLDDLHDNKPGRGFGGILIFKLTNNGPELFWESEEYINHPYVSWRDMDGDGIMEILWDGYLGVTGRSNSYYVYKLLMVSLS